MTLTLNKHWLNTRTAHRLITPDICAELFVNPTRCSKSNRDEQTDKGAKKQCVSPFHGSDIIIINIFELYIICNLL